MARQSSSGSSSNSRSRNSHENTRVVTNPDGTITTSEGTMHQLPGGGTYSTTTTHTQYPAATYQGALGKSTTVNGYQQNTGYQQTGQHSSTYQTGYQQTGQTGQTGQQSSTYQLSGYQPSGYQQSSTYQQSGFPQSQYQQSSYQPQSQYQQSTYQQTGYTGSSPVTSSGRYGGGYVTRGTSGTTLSGSEVVLSERIVEHEVKVPKRIIREDIIEKVIIMPEKIRHEDIVEEIQKVREKIVEVAKPIYQEKIVEVPEIEYVEKIVEVVEKIIQEKTKQVPRIEYQERVIEVPKIITREKIVEVPEIEYREIPFEKIVEVTEIREQVVIKEVPVPQYIDKPIPEYVTVEVPHRVERSVPVPVEAVTTFQYGLPKIRSNYKKVKFPIYVPRFVEVPVPAELVAGAVGQQASLLAQHVSLLTSQVAPSLCEIENIAADLKKMDLANHIGAADYHSAIQNMWSQGRLQIVTSEQFHQRNVGMTTEVTRGTTSPSTYGPVMYNGPHTMMNSQKSKARGQRSSKVSAK